MVPSIKHGGGDVMMWGCFSGKETKKIKNFGKLAKSITRLEPNRTFVVRAEKGIRKRPKPAKNVKELERALHEEWNQIPNNTLLNLIETNNG
uniref:Uncharacterized protein n=1 Tax=Rhizophagus irregularis (strain DAOM 181602 / DAOM 197198 / MUCL 43194) TaxID=747089 RepID=U9SHQ1_RHIID